MSFRTQTHSGIYHRSSTRRGHEGHPNHVDLEEENPGSSRRHRETGEQHDPHHKKRHGSSWMHFGGRTEPLVLLTTVTKSRRPASHTRHHKFDSSRDVETRSSHTTQDPSPSKSSTNSSTHRSQKKTNTSGILSLFFSSVNPQPAKPAKPVKKITCISCLSDDIPSTKAAKLACSHHMCHSCLRRLFILSVADPQQHMPPRCCTRDHVPSKYVGLLFDRDFKIKWNMKYEEYTTKDRYYCPSQRCGKWIKPSNIIKGHNGKPEYGRCSRCRTKCCCLCRGRWHGSQGECPKDENVLRLQAMAKENGWQQCYNCSSIVELKDGCNHMTCRCKAEFCMRCAAKWKTCDCPWFSHNVPDYEEAVGFDDAAVWYTDSDNDEDEDVDDWLRRVVGEPAYRRQEDFAHQYILHQVIRYRNDLHDRIIEMETQPHPEPEQARYVRFAARELRV